jgi:hypothetical protein
MTNTEHDVLEDDPPSTSSLFVGTKVSRINEPTADSRFPRHRGGSNDEGFRLQCQVFSRQIQNAFRLRFVNATWAPETGPDVTSFYRK